MQRELLSKNNECFIGIINKKMEHIKKFKDFKLHLCLNLLGLCLIKRFLSQYFLPGV